MRNQVRNETHNDKEHHVTERKPFQNPTSALNLVSQGHFLRNWGAKIERNFFNEIDLASENWYQHYLQNITKNEIKQEVSTRRYYKLTGTTSHYQILLPAQLLEEFLQSVHGQNSNYPGFTKMIQEARQNYYYPCIAKYIQNRVSNCQICIQTKRINNYRLRTELLNCLEWDRGPEDILQVEMLPNLPPSWGYVHRITAIGVFFWQNMFA